MIEQVIIEVNLAISSLSDVPCMYFHVTRDPDLPFAYTVAHSNAISDGYEPLWALTIDVRQRSREEGLRRLW